MAHKKQAGSIKNGRDSISKRLGVKVFGSQTIKTGQIILRQRGTKFHPGSNVKRTSDDTLIASVDGIVAFIKKKIRGFNGNLTKKTFVQVIPNEQKISQFESIKKTSNSTVDKEKKISKKSSVKEKNTKE